MPYVTYIESDGSSHTVDVLNGDSIMSGATANGIEGIVGACGGSCSCATCHCYVDANWFDRLPAANEIEQGLLDCVAEPRATSRLSCQIIMQDELEGLIVRLPASQY